MSRGAQRADEVLREDQSTRKALGRTFLDELVRSIPKRSDFGARCCQLARPIVYGGSMSSIIRPIIFNLLMT